MIIKSLIRTITLILIAGFYLFPCYILYIFLSTYHDNLYLKTNNTSLFQANIRKNTPDNKEATLTSNIENRKIANTKNNNNEIPVYDSILPQIAGSEYLKTRFNEYTDSIYQLLDDKDLNKRAFRLGMKGWCSMQASGKLNNDTLLSIADFSKSANKKRLFVIDIQNSNILYKTLVAHGMNTGQVYAKNFSNTPRSNKSSIGFFITNETYEGKQGLSLRLDGLESRINNNVRQRGIVIHGADYVSERYIKKYGRIGRSFGCPAIPRELNEEIIFTIKNKSCFFIYYPDKKYFYISNYINTNQYLSYFKESNES